jgi:hypothetical protein
VPDRWEEYHFAISSGGALETESFRLTGGPGDVTQIRVVIPAGHANLTRLRIFYEDSQVIPRSADTWLRGNGRQLWFDIRDKPTGDGWKVKGDNNGTMTHTFHIFFGIDELVADELIPELVLFPTSGLF